MNQQCDNKTELAKKIFSSCYKTGNFILASGLKSKEYFDKYMFESSPELLSEVTQYLLPLIPKETQVLASLEMGGIPLGTALSLKTKLPLRFVRKKAKPYGTMQICEGGDIADKSICLIEDVITTGGQLIKSANELRHLGAKISHAICVIFRGDTLHNIKQNHLTLHYLFSKKELMHKKTNLF